MLKVTSILSALALALTSFSITSVPARAGNGVAAGIIGFAAGAIVGSQLGKGQRQQRSTQRRSGGGRSAEQRAYWKNIQAALNQVGFDAGPVDGAPGRRTKAAIKAFQLSIPAEPTGALTPEQTQLLFARVNPQPAYANQPVNVAPPAGYQNQPTQAFPNVTLPGNGTATTVQPSQQQLNFPAPDTAGDAPITQEPARTPAFPTVTSTANAAPAPVALPAAQSQPAFPSVQSDRDVAEQPQAADTPSFPPVTAAVAAEAQVADAKPVQAPAEAQNVAFPAVEVSAPEVADAAQPAQAPAPAAQAQILVDENGQPYVLVNGQKFLLQAANTPSQ